MIQFAGFEQDGIGNAYFADVVQKAAQDQRLHGFGVEVHGLGDLGHDVEDGAGVDALARAHGRAEQPAERLAVDAQGAGAFDGIAIDVQGNLWISSNAGRNVVGLMPHPERAVSDLLGSQDGVPLGSYSGVVMRENGDVAVNYDNGQTRIVARVPVAAFNDPDKLQRLDGQAFMRTLESGEARVTDAASNGVGETGIQVARIEKDQRPPRLVFNPGHKDADGNGMVAMPNINIHEEMADLITASRAFEANLAVVRNARTMALQTLSIGKR